MQKLTGRLRALLIMLVFLLAFSPLSVLANGEKTNMINYVALGDSLAAGVLSDNSVGDGYVGLIKNKLETKGYTVNVHNKGIPGATTAQVLGGIPSIPEIANADIITVSAGANDILAGLLPILQEIEELQQMAIVAAQEAELSKSNASNSIIEAKKSVDDSQTAVMNVEEAAILVAEELSSIIPHLTPEQFAKLNSIKGHISNAKNSVFKAGENLEAARIAIDTNPQEVATNLKTSVDNISIVVQELNSIEKNIEEIEEFNLPVPIPSSVGNVKNRSVEAIGLVITAQLKFETINLALSMFIDSLEKFNAAKLEAETAGEAATKLPEIPGIIQEVGVNTGKILAAIKSINPTAKVYVMGYYNALPYLPADVQENMTKPMLANLNAAISAPNAQFGTTFIPVADLFEGNYQTYLPNPNDIHPSEAGYSALASGFIGEISKAYPGITEPESNEKDIDLGKSVTVNSSEQIRINGTDVTLILPDNLPEGTTLTVTATSGEALSKANVDELERFGDALNIKFQYPEGFKDYRGTVILVMGYNADSPDDVDIYYFDETEGKWVSQKGKNNQELKTISLDVSHFSNYGVFAQLEQPDDATPPKTEDPDKEPIDGKDNDDESTDKSPIVPGAKDPTNGGKKDTKMTNKDTKGDAKKGNLPNTATNSYNSLILGASLLLLGLILIIITRKNRFSVKG